MIPEDPKAILRSATAELEDRVWRTIIGASTITASAEDDRRLHGAIMSDIRLLLSEAERDISSRLTRQEDETRRAALEEAAKVAEQEEDTYHPGVSSQDVRLSWSRSPRWREGPPIAAAIRVLKEAGHG